MPSASMQWFLITFLAILRTVTCSSIDSSGSSEWLFCNLIGMQLK